MMMMMMMMVIFGNDRSYETTAATIRLLTCYHTFVGVMYIALPLHQCNLQGRYDSDDANRCEYLTSYMYRYSGYQSFDEIIGGKAV